MGMIQTLLRKTPEGKTPSQFCSEVSGHLPEYAAGADEYKCWVLRPEEFEEAWQDQENLKQTDEIKAKYRALTAAGQVIAVEIDW